MRSDDGGFTRRSILVYLAGLAILVGSVLWLNRGMFVYPLDDPYIHLALAENLAQGHHGLNAQEVSSPSSSMLWPLMLVPFSGLGSFDLVPLFLNVIALLALVLLLARALPRTVLPQLAPGPLGVVFLLLALACNFWGMPLNGMEHSLQILLAAMVALGVIELVERDRVTWGLVLGLLLGPLIRFENYAFVPPVLYLLWRTGHRRAASALLAITLVGPVGWMTWQNSHGLPLFPSSVKVKSEVVAAESPAQLLYEIGENALEAVGKSRIQAAVIVFVLLARRIRRDPDRRRADRDRLLLVFAAGAAGAHVLAGSYDWLGRYEIYVMLAVALVMLRAFGDSLAGLVANRRRLALIGLALAALYVGKNQLLATFGTPSTANRIYRMQYQMHRFTVDHWQDSVGVNDVGWVSYRNPHFVFDLWGLGSERARRLRQRASGNDWIEPLLDEYGVDLLMVYAHWFTRKGGEIPENWERVARLIAARPTPESPGRVITIFSRAPERRQEVLEKLRQFQPRLPPGVELEIAPTLQTTGDARDRDVPIRAIRPERSGTIDSLS